MRGRVAIAALVVGVLSAVARADLVLDPPQPITRRVSVQLIQTADGSELATAFGTASQRSDIEAGIDTIWAQAGIDIAILPTITPWNSSFAYDGNITIGTRPGDDLGDIINAADAANKLNDDPLVLDLFLVNIVPAFAQLGENSAAGYARVRGNGIAGFVGDNLLGFGDGRDVISSVMAHEIGHNLGLNHTAGGLPNLMSPNGESEQLDDSQITTARNSSFARLIAAVLAGDYNHDGVVSAADYAVWRNSLGQVASNLPADGNNNGRIDDGDFTVWKNNYGSHSNPGSGGITGVPEPNSILLSFVGLIGVWSARRSRHR